MRYLSFLLIVSVIFCYTGVTSEVHHSSIVPDVETGHGVHHEGHKQEVVNIGNASNSYKSADAAKHEALRCCYYTLLNASHDLGSNLKPTFLYLIAANLPVLPISKVSDSAFLSLKTKRGYRPPDLFLTNSTFLL